MAAPVKNANAEQLEGVPSQAVLVVSGAYTAAATIEFAVPANATIIEAAIWCTLDPASASVTLSLEGYNPGSDVWESLITAAALATVDTGKFIQVNPWVPSVSNVSAQRAVRRRMRARIVVADTDSFTYSVTVYAS